MTNPLPRRTLLAWTTVLAASAAWATPAENDEAMIKLATHSGCMACHSLAPQPRRPDGLPPIAPAWVDVAIKYRNDPAAHERLTQTVIAGSSPTRRHWADKVSAANMPPNVPVVSEADARRLVNWILVLIP